MVKGLDTFRKYFADYKDQYVLIGGAACDIVFESNEVNFRATRDLDMVLSIEALIVRNGLSVLRPEYIILFKAKAYLDLKERKETGENERAA